ncbi:MAG: hypothetical protein JXM70_01525, partial [Pirellulales bacterium]|nr:hypothetical protein [Pirellulales bacterium]
MIRSILWGTAVLAAVFACLIFTTNTVTAEPLSIEQSAKPATGAAKIPPEVRDAMTRFQNRDVAGAVAVLDKAVEANPDLPPTNVIMAQFCGTSQQAVPAVR